MGEYETDAVPMDTLRANVEAIHTMSARVGNQALRAAALETRERLAHRVGPPPERIAAKLDELKRTPKPAADDPACSMAWAIGIGCLTLADEAEAAGDTDTAEFYAGEGYHYVGIALDCEAGGSPTG
ncbi:hypothetical protein [Agromyces sp. NPDC049794]|uniref:hypothetical protein n=1 Tax=unclassified Agromyces TaxID=2639701 RepID=UPI0033DE8A2B